MMTQYGIPVGEKQKEKNKDAPNKFCRNGTVVTGIVALKVI